MQSLQEALTTVPAVLVVLLQTVDGIEAEYNITVAVQYCHSNRANADAIRLDR